MNTTIIAPITKGASESSDDYPSVVVMLDATSSVIECKAGIQWIIQKRVRNTKHAWESLYFCRTKQGLLMYCGPVIPDELMALPDYFPERSPP